MITTQPWLRGVFGVTSPVADNIWFGIQPISAGLRACHWASWSSSSSAGFTPAPKAEVQELVEHVRYPNLNMTRA